jgi:DNA-binding NtrC family response regulator
MNKPDYTLIFIVEDDEAYAKVLSHSLEKRNYMNIRMFSSGEQCIKHMHLKPDVILLDYLLGEDKKDGMDVLKEIKRQDDDVQVVFLTSVDKLEVATQTIRLGAYDYVVKSEGAVERIRNILRRISFENHIKRENRLLKRSRKVIITNIVMLVLGIIALGILHWWR